MAASGEPRRRGESDETARRVIEAARTHIEARLEHEIANL